MKLALIGTGKIIEDALFAMEPVETIERTAIFARPHSRDKAEKFAKQYAIKEVYTDYEELLEKTEADTDQQCSLSICKTGIIGRKECHP